VQLVLGEMPRRDRSERVEPDMKRHALDLESREELRCEVQAGGRRGRRTGFACVHRLVALWIGQRLDDVRRERRLSRGLAVQPEPPAPLAEMLE
jgi:hypothetical protein